MEIIPNDIMSVKKRWFFWLEQSGQLVERKSGDEDLGDIIDSTLHDVWKRHSGEEICSPQKTFSSA